MPAWLPFAPAPLLLVSAALLIRAADREPPNEFQVRIWKPASTLLVILMCVLSLLMPTSDPTYTAVMLLALIFCLLGDVLLIPKHKPAWFAYGLGAFLVAQLLFTVGFAVSQAVIGTPFNPAREVVTAALLVVLVGGVFLYLRPNLGKMKWPVLFYMVVISLMLHRAIVGLYVGSGVPWQPFLAAAGALMFYVSDFVLAINRFAFDGELPHHQLVVLGTYYCAIALLALSASFVFNAGVAPA